MTQYNNGKLHKMKVKVSLSHTILRLEHFHYLKAEISFFFSIQFQVFSVRNDNLKLFVNLQNKTIWSRSRSISFLSR